MGFPLYREVMEHAPGKLGMAEMLLLLVIADDANDRTRLSFATRDKLIRRMRVTEWDTVQKILNRLGKQGLELRVPIGVDKHGRPFYARAGMRSTYRIPEFASRGDGRPPSPRADDGPTSMQGGQPSDQQSRADDGPRDADEHPGEVGQLSARRGRTSAPSPHPSKVTSSLSSATPVDLVRASGVVADGEERDLIEWMEKNNKIQGMGWWVTVCGNGTINTHAAGWQATRTAKPPPKPPWCGHCDERTRWLEDDTTGRPHLCTCHPRHGQPTPKPS